MNRSTATSQAVLQHLLDAGVRHIVVSPGSRSAGLAWAAAQAQEAGMCQLHVRIDEREAGFLALGLAKTDREPAAVIVTSGTAVANLLPAIVEAHYAAVPVVAVTADRPVRVRGRGAPQTVDQPPMFTAFVAGVVDLDAADPDLASVPALLHSALGVRRQPVHLNVQFDLPLMPDDRDWRPVPSSAQVRPQTSEQRPAMDLPDRGVVVVGDVVDSRDTDDAADLAERKGWPLLWEPSANAHGAPTAVSHGPVIAARMPVPDVVVTVGSVGLSRTVLGLLRATPEHIAVHCAANGPDTPDPMVTAARVLTRVPTSSGSADLTWLANWRTADQRAADVIADALRPETLTGPSTAVALWDHLRSDSTLLVGASWPVRHIEAFAPSRAGVRVVGNRGANGIDGLVSTAYGVAVRSTTRTYALMGDVSFLYGSAGLLHISGLVPDLTVVVADNDGSGIFSQLEQGAPEYDTHFDEVFGTPHGRDLWVVAESLGAAACRVTTRSELQAALTRTDAIPGLHVIVCTTGSRAHEAELLRSIAARLEV